MTKYGTRHLLAFFALLASSGPCAFAGGDTKDTAKPLPAEVVKAWVQAGATPGWMKDTPPKRASYDFWAPFRDENEPGAMPAFRFHPKNEDVLAKLPDPGTPFGLDFHCSPVTGPWLRNMAGLTSLRSLNVGGSLTLTDEGLKELGRLKNLQGLYLFYAHVTDGGLKALAGLEDLRTLDLSHTQVKGAGLKELAGLKSLQALNLGYTKVTDATLKELAGMKSLRWLNLHGTRVTAAGIAAVRNELPACKIIFRAD